MLRHLRTPVALATIALATASVAAARPSAAPTVRGTVGPGFTITLGMNGKRVTHLKPGTYTFVVKDRAATHNFVLEKKKGGTFEKELTGVSFTGTKTVRIKLTRGAWEYYCRPHESTMHHDFTVG
jgi:plastocyanin